MEHTNSLSKTASWVIVDILTDDVIKETFEKQEVVKLNIKRYKTRILTEFKSKSLYMRLLLLMVVNR